ncbi:Acetyl-CoA acetyltransferase [Lunatimonas lonarensis]|uniref:Acetyl-CoA acetyltransferase n=1 Tax=Lunatimonas lonarensis TaxID=1232681 RepID=R7ZPD4_9BACT|nr:acetyl-CoA C-acyltransferase [Lunatimonas lonarensis]EON75960.1 Acetyl-CoA acetyltransferase [Lunatimonas lonarensis]
MKVKDVYIVSLARTPLGSYGGSLSSLSAVELGAASIRGAMERVKLDNDQVGEVYFGNVLSANLGQAPARQVALGAGLGQEVPCTTIHKVCASGMKAVMLGAQSIMLGQQDIVVAGGMESMSNVPYYVPNARFGQKFGNGELVDGLVKDGLLEVYHKFPMGNCAEHTSKAMGISREEQDDYAIRSYERAQEAWKLGLFSTEVVPIEIKGKKGEIESVEEDEEYNTFRPEKIRSLRPVFQPENGTVTAANASTLSDGAAALVLMSGDKLAEHGIKPIAKILGFADAAQDPLWFTTAPALAIPKALKHAGISPEEVGYYEINEAFAAVAIANQRLLGIPSDRLNVFGGAVALGHPLGCSGARILCTLNSVLSQKGARIGVAGICNGGGGASAMVIERIDF